jgi:hypothetical protein
VRNHPPNKSIHSHIHLVVVEEGTHQKEAFKAFGTLLKKEHNKKHNIKVSQ